MHSSVGSLSAVTSTSPLTGWGRAEWADLADRSLAAVRPYASPGHARITLPGPEGGYGRAVDGLEGFARTFLLAGFRLAGEAGHDPHGLAEWYARGLETGTDPTSPDRWVRLDEHPQAKVEAASVALVLDLTRPWIWDRLTPVVQQRVVDYLSPAVGDDTYPRINWVWFRLVVQTFLRSVGGPSSADEMAEDLATHDGFARADGWMADGRERSFDHYVGWALHLYPVLWSRMAGAADLAADRRDRDVAALDRFLRDAVTLVGADGSPLLQGRSLSYRFAAAAPFWVGAMAEVPSLSPGLLRRAASGVMRHFVDHGAFDERGLLTTGWHGPWPALAQSYSGPGSPYWSSKGMLGLALPADHPVWTAPEEPLPVERGDVVRAVRAPGWVVSATQADGVVRVVNHGTDHAVEGSTTGDSPLYARLGYSTATVPLLDPAAWVEPLDQSVVLLDREGRATHRSGMRVLGAEVLGTSCGDVGLAASSVAAHWLEPVADQQRHGYGYVGTAVPAGRLTVASLVRGPWELRLVRVDDVAPGVDPAALRLRIGGWPVSGPDGAVPGADGPVPLPTGPSAVATTAGLVSRVVPVLGDAEPGTTRVDDAGPLGASSVVPWVVLPVEPGAWVAVLVELTRGSRSPHLAPTTAAVDGDPAQPWVTATWPDGARTRTPLVPQSGRADPGDPVAKKEHA